MLRSGLADIMRGGNNSYNKVFECFYSLESIRLNTPTPPPPPVVHLRFLLDYWQAIQLLPHSQIKYGVALPKQLPLATFFFPWFFWPKRLISFSGTQGASKSRSQFVGDRYDHSRLSATLRELLVQKSGAWASLLLYYYYYSLLRVQSIYLSASSTRNSNSFKRN